MIYHKSTKYRNNSDRNEKVNAVNMSSLVNGITIEINRCTMTGGGWPVFNLTVIRSLFPERDALFKDRPFITDIEHP